MTEDQRLKRNAYMREWNSKNRERVNCAKRSDHARELANKRNRERWPNRSPEAKAKETVRLREWVKSQSEEYKQKRLEQIREYGRAKRLTVEGAAKLAQSQVRYREKNREIVNARARAKRDNPTPEHKAKKSEADRKYRLKWTQEKKDADRERHLSQRRANPDRHNANNQRRRSLKKGNGGSYTAEEWQELKSLFGNTCLCCRRSEPEIKLTVDHVIPLSKGGLNAIENIQPLCVSCNASKQARTTDFRISVSG